MNDYNRAKLMIFSNLIFYESTKTPIYYKFKATREDIFKLKTYGVNIHERKELDFYRRISRKGCLLNNIIKMNHGIIKDLNSESTKKEQATRFKYLPKWKIEKILMAECKEMFEAKQRVIREYAGGLK